MIEVDRKFQPHNDAFNNDNIGANEINKRFHITYNDVSATVANQNTTQDNVTMTVSLFFSGARDATEALDSAMDVANEYRMNCLRMKHLTTQHFIKRVVCTNIKPEPLVSNDNAIKIILTFNVQIIFGTGVDLNC